jgi:condensin complex subunit 2
MVGATPKPGAGGFGSQLVTQGGRRARPEYVAYARVAKKIDVRRLKQEMWKGMGERLIASTEFDSTPQTRAGTDVNQVQNNETEPDAPPTPTPQRPQPVDGSEEPKEDRRLRFTQIMNSLKTVYPPEKLRDISTSFGFICLLHLANEQGLILQNDGLSEGVGAGSLEEIYVAKDANAVIDEASA